MNITNVTIFGVGALACLYGSQLDEFVNVTLVGRWPAQLAHVQQHGLTVTHLDDQQTHHHLTMTDNLYHVPWADVVLVLVKSYQTARVAPQIAQLLKPNGLVVTLQNGFGNQELLAQHIPPHQITVGVTAQGATMVDLGHVRHAGNGPTYLAAHATITANQLNPVATLFNQARFATTVVKDAQSLLWGKLVINAAINPITALLECPNGHLATEPQLAEITGRIAEEVAMVAQGHGIDLPYQSATQRVLEVCQATAANRSSMLQDITRGSQTEIGAICGAVVQSGAEINIPTPLNQWLLKQVQQKETETNRHPFDAVDLVTQLQKI